MSFISVVAMETFITVVTDGQVTRGYEIIDNNFKKYRKISNKQFIAFGGAKEVCESLVNHLEFIGDNNYDLHVLANDLYETVKNIPFGPIKTMFAIGGVNNNGEIEMFTLNNDPKDTLRIFSPKGTDLSYAFLSSNVDDNVIYEKFVQLLSITGFNTPNKCIKAQKMLNQFVSSIDHTVNRITFELRIKL